MKKISLNKNWCFCKEGEAFYEIDLPHDAMQLEKRVPDLADGSASGYFPGGKYIYEKVLPKEDAPCLLIEFEGVYRNSEIYVNGERVGGHRYGYTNFYVDVSGKLTEEENILRVIADNSQTPNARWYTGSGIYRNVWLYKSGAEHFIPDGTRIQTLSLSPARVKIDAGVCGEGEIELIVKDKRGNIVAKQTECTSVFELEIADAKPWSAERPNLYTFEFFFVKGGDVVDAQSIKTGLRTIAWNAEEGFLINGKSVKLRGGCIHHDHGILGARSYIEAERRRIERLKEAGFNAIRSSHYPAGKDLLNACDELGMYVMDETFDVWKVAKNKYDYSLDFDACWREDVRAMVAKDYNHPCVVMYSIGNEITEAGTPLGAQTARMLCDELHALDSRPVTAGLNILISYFGPKIAKMKEKKEGVFGSQQFNDFAVAMKKVEEMYAKLDPKELIDCFGETFACIDIIGFNYGERHFERLHELLPDRVMLGTETFPSRIVENWRRVKKHPYIIGDFMWTAWDYLGEAGVGHPEYGVKTAQFAKPYPCLTADCGAFDLIGKPDTQAHLNRILWKGKPRAYIAVHPVDRGGQQPVLSGWRMTDAVHSWAWFGYNCAAVAVDVYSNAKKIVLYQNGVRVAERAVKEYQCSFEVPYLHGYLRAVGYNGNGKEICEDVLYADGAKLSLCMTVQKVKREDEIVFVELSLRDERGTVPYTRDIEIEIQVEGGKLLAFGSAHPENTQTYIANSHTTYRGRLLAVIKRTNKKCVVRAHAKGLREAILKL